MIVDSNILIYAADPADNRLYHWLLSETPSVSAVSKLEVLGYYRFGLGEKKLLENLLRCLLIVYPTPLTFEIAVRLRQRRKMSVPDSLIAACALERRETLATHDIRDFTGIENLTLFDPVSV